MTIDDIMKAEYDITIELWKMMSKYLKKIPLSMDDYKSMEEEANEIARKREGKSQDVLARWITAIETEVEHIDVRYKQINEKKED